MHILNKKKNSGSTKLKWIPWSSSRQCVITVAAKKSIFISYILDSLPRAVTVDQYCNVSVLAVTCLITQLILYKDWNETCTYRPLAGAKYTLGILIQRFVIDRHIKMVSDTMGKSTGVESRRICVSSVRSKFIPYKIYTYTVSLFIMIKWKEGFRHTWFHHEENAEGCTISRTSELRERILLSSHQVLFFILRGDERPPRERWLLLLVEREPYSWYI